jgi:outer membrane protein, multidrug efflux system
MAPAPWPTPARRKAQANLPGHPPPCHPEQSRGIAVQENTISILLGHNPEDIHRGLDVASQSHPQQVPTGVPSRLLERRPDIQRAEATLIAANARIGGRQKRNGFPRSRFTNLGGSVSSQLQSMFAGKNAY